MNAQKPVRIAIAGIGGYAGEIANLIVEHGPACDPPATLSAVCDPDLKTHAARAEALRGRGVAVFDSYDAMLDGSDAEGVWLPIPIPLHRPFTERALAAGKPVMVEKPAAGSVQDVDAMIAASERAGLPVTVGFQDVYDGTTLPLKRRLLAGEFGRVTSASVWACWPRSERYFGRSGWAGRLRVGDDWVLDSPANNALAHFVHIGLFLLGAEEADNADVQAVEAELYRAAPIENYDTISARAELPGGAPFLVLLTHATATTRHPILTIRTERATIRRTNAQITIDWADGRSEAIERDGRMRNRMLQRYARLIRGLPEPDTATATLAMARQHTLFINGVSEATPVTPVPPAAIEPAADPQGSPVHAIPGIEAAFEACADRDQLLHESGRFDWTRRPDRLDLRDYRRFTGPASDDASRTVSTR